MKWKVSHNFLLAGCVVVLLVLCCLSILTPLHFEKERERREREVKHHLLLIRAAEERFRQEHGFYCADFAILVKHGYLADSLQYVPFTPRKRFTLVTSVTTDKQGNTVPLMECGALLADYLQGLDETEVTRLVDETYENGAYPGLKIGDVERPNGNAASWE